MLNIVVIIVGKILRLNHNLERDFDRIVVAKYKGMGSIIQTLPLLHGIRNKYPKATIIFATSKGNKKLIDQLNPLVDQCYFIDDSSVFKLSGSIFQFLFKIIRFRPQVFIDLEIYSNASTLLTTMSLATNRFGYFLRSEQYRKGLYSHMLFFNTNTPIYENYKQMGRMLGIENFESQSNINLDDTDIPIIDGSYLVINPNASDLRLERRWPDSSFIELIKHLSNNHNYKIVLIGASNEAQYVNQLVEDLENANSIVNLAGKSSIMEMFNIIKHTKILITNDTGPMHLGFYFKTPTVALFGPCQPGHYGLSGENISIHYANTYCSPCVHEFEEAPCKGDNQCMKNISISQVIESTDLLIKGQAKNYISLPVLYSTHEPLGVVRRS